MCLSPQDTSKRRLFSNAKKVNSSGNNEESGWGRIGSREGRSGDMEYE